MLSTRALNYGLRKTKLLFLFEVRILLNKNPIDY